MPTQTVVHAPAPPPTKVGVGLVLRERSDGCHSVKRLKPGQAADHCGQIEPGDLLTHVDSLDIARGVASQFLADLIAGPQGSVVNLTFEKPDGSRVSINLLRGNADYIADVLRHENEGGAPPPPDPYSRAVEMYPPPRKQEMTSPPPVMPLEAMLAQSVGVSIALDEDYDSLVTSPERLQNFNVTFRQDVANAIRANPNRVQLVGLQRSTGIVVDLNIFPDYDDERSPQRLAAELAAQVADPRSLLRNAPSTRRVTKADVHVGHVSPPPNAAVMPPRQSDAGEAVGPPPTGHYPAAPPQPSRLNDSPAPTAPAPGTAAEKRAKAAALANSQASPRGMGKVVPMNVTGGGPAVPLPSTVDIAPPNTQDYGGEVQFEIALKNDASQRTGVVSVSSSGRLPDLLQASSSSLACNEITRVFHANGAPLIRLAEAKAGSRLLMQAAAKGQFESWSPGLVVKRRYVLRERIGEGGLGAQWLAVDSLQDQDILLVEEGDETALSVRDAILAERGQGEESNRRRWREERFLREMQVCIKVSSPNVCRVLDHGLQQGRMFQAVERLQGKSLAEAMMSNPGPMSEAHTKSLTIQLLQGLEAAHIGGLSHSNLVPANVFLANNGIKVLGLGVALWEPEMISNAALRLPVKAMPQYMSPEQVSGRLTDHRSDLWSVGVLMFRCVSGKLPFDGATFINIVQAIVTGTTPEIGSPQTPVSPEFARIVQRALSKDPDHRFGTAAEMRQALEMTP
eukprot:Tamp_08064.p1 GENE.Tamp_08064~~Tamp_08064.p1  ORF type:complete len:769 (-),score=168.39 Tamp_08064:81-2297(-)